MSGKLTVEIRAATAEDVLSISALAIYVFLDTYATEGIRPDLAREVFSEYSADVFLSRLTSSNSVEIYLAEIDGHIVGFAEIDCAAKCAVVGMDGGVEIAKLYVQPKFHSQGVGKALLGSVEQRARDLDLKQIWLTAWTGNLNAIGFYDHCGFSDIGRVNFNIEDQNYENRLFTKHLI
jgi:GNAT superfamily N-acetyltransferase